jgi:hypothetical protein
MIDEKNLASVVWESVPIPLPTIGLGGLREDSRTHDVAVACAVNHGVSQDLRDSEVRRSSIVSAGQ